MSMSSTVTIVATWDLGPHVTRYDAVIVEVMTLAFSAADLPLCCRDFLFPVRLLRPLGVGSGKWEPVEGGEEKVRGQGGSENDGGREITPTGVPKGGQSR